MTNRRMQGLLEWLDGERLVASGHRAATIENHLKNALEVDKILNERPPSGEMVMVPRELINRAVLWFHTLAENGMDATFSDGERTPNAVAMDDLAAQFSVLSAAEASKEAK